MDGTLPRYQQDHAPRCPLFPCSTEDCVCLYGKQLIKSLNGSFIAVGQNKTHHRTRAGPCINVPGLGAYESPTMSNSSSAIALGLGAPHVNWVPRLARAASENFISCISELESAAFFFHPLHPNHFFTPLLRFFILQLQSSCPTLSSQDRSNPSLYHVLYDYT